MSSYWAYQSCSRCVGGAQPGTVDLLKYLMIRFPRTFSMGIYSCRLPSIHSCGRAIDLGIPFLNNGSPNLSLGNETVRFVNSFAHQFGIHGQIFNRIRYDAKTPGGRYYTGPSPHLDHNHIEQRLQHAQSLKFADYERIAGPAEGGTVPTYRRIDNVPWDKSTNKPKSYAKEAIDDGIAVGAINIDDDFIEDWERPLNYGAFWVSLDRLGWPKGTRQ